MGGTVDGGHEGVEAEAASLILATEKIVEPLRKALARYKLFVRIGAVLLVLMVAAFIILGFVAVGQSRDNSQLAAQNAALKASTIMLCQSGNVFRQGEQSIWDKLFAISYAAQKPTPQNRKLGEEFLAYVAQVDAQHNCKALVK